jgi:hypothetical protein
MNLQLRKRRGARLKSEGNTAGRHVAMESVHEHEAAKTFSERTSTAGEKIPTLMTVRIDYV